MTQVDVKQITGVPETLLIPLYARAVESNRPDGIVRDEKAVEMVGRIDYDFTKFDLVWMSQVGVAVRTEILDEQVAVFISRHPDAAVVNLGAGLCARFNRVENGRVTWYELDLPEVSELRHRFFTSTDRHRFIAASVTDFAWMEQIQRQEDEPLLFIGKRLFMYFEEADVKRVFIEMAARFPGAELLIEINGPMLVGRSKHHDTVSKMKDRPEFKWGLPSGGVCAEWNPRIEFVQEWNYLDRHRDRWCFLRWAAYVPPLKRWMMNKIAHLKLLSTSKDDKS